MGFCYAFHSHQQKGTTLFSVSKQVPLYFRYYESLKHEIRLLSVFFKNNGQIIW